ncbi:hypothetical protein BGZ47_003823 [Haplosporangium gracile]|nr:hypothetical protein BGZ47_003823 [Haplosporangium gracile]
MPRRLRNKEFQKNSESESDDGDVYQEEQDVSMSPTPSQSPSPSPTASPTPSSSPAPASASPNPLPVILSSRRVTRSSTPKDRKVAAATTSKTLETPRTIITRARVVKSQAAVIVRRDQSEGDIESVGNTKLEADPELFKIPTPKKPRPRTKSAVAGGREAPTAGGQVEFEGAVKSLKTPAPKKPRAKCKGRRVGDQSEGAAESEVDANPAKTPKSRRSRAKAEGLGAAASWRAKTTAIPKKPRAPRPKKIMKETAVPATTPLIASIQDNDDGNGPSVGLLSKVSSPLGSSMDGIEMHRSAAVLQALNRDYEMAAMPQQERNGGEHQYRLLHDTVSRSSTVLTVAPTLNETGRTGQDTARATHIKSVFSPTIKEEPRMLERAEPTVPVDRHQISPFVLDDRSLFSLSVKSEPYVAEPLGSRSITSAPDTPLISLQKPSSPIIVSRSGVLKLDLSTVQPWEMVTVPTPTSSMPSFLARIDNPPSAAITPFAAALLAPPETVDDLATIVEKTFDEASQYLLGAMELTKRALEDQAHAIRFHAVALEAFGQGMTMTESQCHTLFPQEQFADLAVRSALFPLPQLQAPSASVVTSLSVTLAPVAQSSTSTHDESVLITVVRNMKRELETTLSSARFSSLDALQKYNDGLDPHTAQYRKCCPLAVELRLCEQFGLTFDICTQPTGLHRHYTTTAVIVFGSGIGTSRCVLYCFIIWCHDWTSVKEQSTSLYLKAVKSYEDSKIADRIASGSHNRFMDASKRWYAATGHTFPYDCK